MQQTAFHIRFALALAGVLAANLATGSGTCTVPGWASHQLQVLQTSPTSSINASNLPIAQSLYGIEGGHIVRVGDELYVFLAEFTAPPHFVPSKLSLWRAHLVQDKAPAHNESYAWPTGWTRLRTLFTSTGTVNCDTFRSSLGSSIAVAFNEENDHYEVFYVGFKSCNDSHFVNRDGHIYRAISAVGGNSAAGIEGPYNDAGVVFDRDNSSQPWEGLQAVDSMQPYSLGGGRGWAAFYGSANTQDPPPTVVQVVGRATASHLGGPWVRSPADHTAPCNLSAASPKIEQPMVTRLKDGTFAAFFDAIGEEVGGHVGYSWSPDGVNWDPLCSQLLDLRQGGAMWMTDKRARTPQGAVELSDGSLLLSFSGFDGAGDNPLHESLGLAVLQFE